MITNAAHVSSSVVPFLLPFAIFVAAGTRLLVAVVNTLRARVFLIERKTVEDDRDFAHVGKSAMESRPLEAWLGRVAFCDVAQGINSVLS